MFYSDKVRDMKNPEKILVLLRIFLRFVWALHSAGNGLRVVNFPCF